MDPEPFDRIDPSDGFCATRITFYAALYPALREVARTHGYALAVHGSLKKDLDVIAVPWTEDAASEAILVRALVDASGGFTVKKTCGSAVTDKPHGRRAWTIHLGKGGGYVDLSVMPLGLPV